jgi:hypothetical protein
MTNISDVTTNTINVNIARLLQQQNAIYYTQKDHRVRKRINTRALKENQKEFAKILNQCKVSYADNWDIVLGFSKDMFLPSTGIIPKGISAHILYRDKIKILSFQDNVLICKDFNHQRLVTITNPLFYTSTKLLLEYPTIAIVRHIGVDDVAPSEYGYTYKDLCSEKKTD